MLYTFKAYTLIFVTISLFILTLFTENLRISDLLRTFATYLYIEELNWRNSQFSFISRGKSGK